MREGKTVFEAVIAIPFIVENSQRKFFEIPREDIERASTNESVDSQTVGRSVINMINKLKKYVLPPQFDFINRKDITPFAMYVFEFSHHLNKQDLSDIWQGIMPKISVVIDEAESKISHKLLSSELLGGGTEENTEPTPANRNKNKGLELNSRIRWMVFKAKQRAKTNYYDLVVKKPSMTDKLEAEGLDVRVNSEEESRIRDLRQKIQFNWPYDFFSLVELVKLDASVEFSATEESDDVGTFVTTPHTSSSVPTIDPSIRVVNPNLSQDLAAGPSVLRSAMSQYTGSGGV
jgi:hypothetical protein